MNKHFRFSGSTFRRLEELGVSVPAVLRRAGLPHAYVDEPRVLLKTDELFAFWRAIGEVSTNAAIGIQHGTENKTGRFLLTGLAALAPETLGATGDQMARYKQLNCPEEILQKMLAGEWSIQFRWLLAHEAEPPVLIECAFFWMLSIARHGTGTRLSPLRVEFLQPRAYAKAIERHFGCEVVCGAPRNAMVFRIVDANRPFVTRNAEVLSVLAPQFEKELNQEDGEDENFMEHVCIGIQQKLTGRRPSIEDIADSLHISSRTLQQQLQDEGASFQGVLEEARHQLSRQYLNNPVLELNGAAYPFGHEDGILCPGFSQLGGSPPARWREQQRTRAAS